MFEAKQFTFPFIEGISPETLEEHTKLYEGYVKNANLILEKIKECKQDEQNNTYIISELYRRFAFEFNGIRNHEYYFEQLEGGHKALSPDAPLNKKIIEDFGSIEKWFESFTSLAMTRGIGWAVLWYDKKSNKLIQNWVDEQHLGQLSGLTFIYGIDMWEHSYLMDYTPGEKRKYIEAYTKATNQEVVGKRFEDATR